MGGGGWEVGGLLWGIPRRKNNFRDRRGSRETSSARMSQGRNLAIGSEGAVAVIRE